MGNSYGIRSLGTIGRTIQLLANNDGTRWKVGAVTIDWDTVTAAPAAITLEDSIAIALGDKYLRYGQVICEITASGKFGPYAASAADGRQNLVRGKCFCINETVLEAEDDSNHPGGLEAGRVWRARLLVETSDIQTITINATGGTFTITFDGQTTTALAYNASAAAVQAALEALSNIAPGDVSVGLTGAVYTLTFSPGFYAGGTVPTVTTNAASLTGGAGTAAVAVITTGDTTPSVAIFEAAMPGILYAP